MPQQINQSYLKARHIPLTDFTAYESDVMKKGKLKEQYEYLWQIGVYQPTDASMMDRTWYKNRYSNVLPYDHSRVKLATLPGEPGSDYINASYIPGYKLKQEYIAAQGPLSSTIGDFWRMVWEQDVQSVVMVAKLTVVDRTGKSIKYWKEEPLHCCGISITLQSEKIDKHWTVREFLLVKDKTEHTVKHYQFTAEWPVYDIPDDTGPLLDLVKYFRSQQDACDSNHGPVVVHCDGGVGRTGTFIALDILLQHIEDNDWVDVFGLACEMRRYRQRMIETELQYIFIHKALTDVINSRK